MGDMVSNQVYPCTFRKLTSGFMNYQELLERYYRILSLLKGSRVTEAMDDLSLLVDKCRDFDYRNRLNNAGNTYRNMLKYSFELGDDPEKQKVYLRLVKSLLELTDEVKEEIIRWYGLLSYYTLLSSEDLQSNLEFEETGKWLERVSFEQDLEDSGEAVEIQEIEEKIRQSGQAMKSFFLQVWLTDKLSEKEMGILRKTGEENILPWYYKSLIVSALTLSTLRHFDVNKIHLLFELYQKQEHQVWQRALTGILISLYIYDHRIQYYPELNNLIGVLRDDSNLNKVLENIVLQFLRARDTEELAEKIRKEFLPEIWKMRSTLEEKLNMEDLFKENLLEDKNPEWETVFEDSPDLYNKMEEFSNLQMEGSDVFISAFAMLKRFPFFNEVHHWLLPFYKENPQFEEAFREVKEGFDSGAFLEGLEKSSFLCNSDKYSFCLNVKHMPPMQKSMMVEVFNMEINAMNEMEQGEDLINNNLKNRSVFVQYIQDLYRFFRLHPRKKEFEDVFSLQLDFHNTGFFRRIINDDRIIRNIGEFYFEKEHFTEALDVFLYLIREDKDYELIEKAAYCFERMGKFEEALEYYKKAEIISPERTWLLNKIAYCNRRLGNYEKAIEYYLTSEKAEPENLFVQTSLGQVHMDTGDYEKALKYFFKVEYLAPDNTKVHRPIAWCSFLLGKHETAEKYLARVIEKEGNKYDYMNMGHLKWVAGDKKKAIGFYRSSLTKSGMDFEWFARTFGEDIPHLTSFNIPGFDIPLMLDYLRIGDNEGENRMDP